MRRILLQDALKILDTFMIVFHFKQNNCTKAVCLCEVRVNIDYLNIKIKINININIKYLSSAQKQKEIQQEPTLTLFNKSRASSILCSLKSLCARYILLLILEFRCFDHKIEMNSSIKKHSSNERTY